MTCSVGSCLYEVSQSRVVTPREQQATTPCVGIGLAAEIVARRRIVFSFLLLCLWAERRLFFALRASGLLALW